MAAQAWRGLDDAGRRKILNGWRPKEPTTVRAVMAEINAGLKGETAGRVLAINCTDDAVYMQPEMELTHGLRDSVRITILEGTSKLQAALELTAMLDALVSDWQKGIDVDDDECHIVPRSVPQLKQGKIRKPKSSTLPTLQAKSGKRKAAAAN